MAPPHFAEAGRHAGRGSSATDGSGASRVFAGPASVSVGVGEKAATTNELSRGSASSARADAKPRAPPETSPPQSTLPAAYAICCRHLLPNRPPVRFWPSGGPCRGTTCPGGFATGGYVSWRSVTSSRAEGVVASREDSGGEERRLKVGAGLLSWPSCGCDPPLLQMLWREELLGERSHCELCTIQY